MSGSVLQFRLQGVVVKQPGGQRLFDGREGGDGTASLQRKAAGGCGGVAGCGDGVGHGLVQVGQGLQLHAMLADV